MFHFVECYIVHVPGCGAVFVQNIEIFGRKQFASIHSRLNGSQAPQDAHLFDIADNRNNIKAL